ncbi:MAG: hypothetical protein ACFB02_22685 [Mastigocoleus sp.]
MSLSDNDKNKQDCYINRKLNLEYPRVILASRNIDLYKYWVYQLPNGSQVMTKRQIGKFVEQSRDDVDTFIKYHDMEAMTVELPNRELTQVYSLSTCVAYLERLLANGRLRFHRLSLKPREWDKLIDLLSTDKGGKAITPNPCYFDGSYSVVSAQAIPIQLNEGIDLEILVLPSGEYRIEHEEGLRCIKAPSKWLSTHSSNKAKIFNKLKLSRDIVECRIHDKESEKSLYTLNFSEWLSIWKHFASRRNTKAVAVLTSFARTNLHVRICQTIN